MFYHEKLSSGYYIWNDHTTGKYGPFETIYSKNNFYGIDILFNAENYPGHKYSLGFTKKRIFILQVDGKLDIINK